MTALYWVRYKAGEHWLMDGPKGTPRSMVGRISPHYERDPFPRRGGWCASYYATTDGRPVYVVAGTIPAARKALEIKLDAQSLGLFGVDDLTFVDEGDR